VAAWLASTGEVCHVSLLARSGKMAASAQEELRPLLAASEVSASVHALDMGSAADCAALLAGSVCGTGGVGPLQALFHASGVLGDALLANQSLAGLRRVAAPKLAGQARMQAGLAALPVEQVGNPLGV
jgi:hypothetical protein